MKKFFILIVTILLIVCFTFPTMAFGDEAANDGGGESPTTTQAPPGTTTTETTIPPDPTTTTETTIVLDETTTTLNESSTTIDETTTTLGDSSSSTESTETDSEEPVDLQPVLKLEIISNSSVANSGEDFVYKVKLTNTGNADANNINIQSHIPENFGFVSASNNGIFNPEISNVVWEIGSLSPGSIFESEVRISTPLMLADGTTKTLTVMVKSDELPIGSTSADFTVSNVFDKTDNFIELNIDCLTENVVSGGEAEFEINVINSSSYTQTGVVLTGNIPDEADIVNASGNYSSEGNKITWDIGEVSPNSSSTISLTLKINEGFLTNQVLTGLFKVTSNESADMEKVFSMDVAADDSTILNNLIDFSIDVSDSSVAAGSEFTYYIKIKNNGSVTAENIVVTDCLNENLSFISASEGYVIDGNNIKWDIAGMEAGGEKALEITVDLSNTILGNTVISNAASFDCDQSDLISANIDVTAIKEILTDALELTMTDNPDPVATGSSVTYTINYKNKSESTLSNVILTDFLPVNIVLVSASYGSIIQGTEAVVWELGTLQPGESGSVEIVVNIPISTGDGTIIINKAVIDSDETEPVTVIEETLDPTPTGSQTFYVFGDAVEVLDLLSSRSSPAYVADKDEGIHSVLSISNGVSGNVWVYLHSYSDPTDFNPLNPATSANFQSLNGYDVVSGAIIIPAGGVLTIDDLIYTTYMPDPLDPNTWLLAGGDLVYILGGPVNVVRGFAPVATSSGSGNVLAEFFNLYPTNVWDTDYTIPVGVDTLEKYGNNGTGADMEYTDLMVQAMENNTEITIVNNGVTTKKTLQKGDSYILTNYSNVHQGATVHATKPIQAGLLTSSGGRVDTRNYTLSSKQLLGSDYYIPVVTGTGDRLYIYAYDNNTTVKIYDGVNTRYIDLEAGEVDSSYVIDSSATRSLHITSYDRTDPSIKRTVLILGAADSNGDDKDWGFQAIDSSYYSSNYVTPYAPGDNVGTGGSTSYYSTQVKTTVNIGDDSIYANYLNYNSFSNSGYIKIDNEIIYYSQKERTRPDPQHYYDTIIFSGLNRGIMGSTETSHSVNGNIFQYNPNTDASWNPLYVTPIVDDGTATRVYVDWNGDWIADPPYAGAPNNYIDLNEFGIAKLYDIIEGDGDNGGALIWALSATAGGTGNWARDKLNSNVKIITVYYGEASNADSSLGYDWGYSLIPLSPKFVTSLIINKSSEPASDSNVFPGDTIKYTLSYENTGDTTLSSIVITDMVPANTSLVDGSISSPGSVSSGGVITWSLSGTLAPGAEGEVSFSVKVNSTIPSDVTTIENYGTIDSEQTTPLNSNYVHHNLLKFGQVTLTKTFYGDSTDANFYLKGVDGKYYTSTGVAKTDKADAKQTISSNGTLTWTNLPWQEYTVEEDTISGYTLSISPSTFTISGTNLSQSVTATNTQTKGQIELTKTGLEAGATAYFKLKSGTTYYNTDGTVVTNPDTYAGEAVTLTSNKITWNNLPWGTYSFEEIVPTGYTGGTLPSSVTIDSSNAGIKVTRSCENTKLPPVTTTTTPPVTTTTTIAVLGLAVEEETTPPEAGRIEVLGIQELPFTGQSIIVTIIASIILIAGISLILIFTLRKKPVKKSEN